MLIARQAISAQQVDSRATHLKTIIKNECGPRAKHEYCVMRTLSYRLKQNRTPRPQPRAHAVALAARRLA